MRYRVEHMRGTAGGSEKTVEQWNVEATTERKAIRSVFGKPDNYRWNGSLLMNMDAANKSGAWCDYVYAEAWDDEAFGDFE